MNIEQYITDVMQQQHLPGVAVAIAQQGNTLFAQGYGFANLELRVPVTSETVFQIASITKPFTATLAMLLVQEGKLQLDVPIDRYFEHAPAAWQQVTARQLLSHTSGIVRDGIPEYWTTPSAQHQNYSRDQMLDIIKQSPLDFAPGEQKSYSNSAYFLLGLIIEKITGQDYATVLQERIITPLGMRSARINDTKSIVPDRASGYVWNDDHWENSPYIGLDHHFSNGGLLASLNDLLIWNLAIYQKSIVSAAQLQQMWTPTNLADGTPTDRGLGWSIQQYKEQRLIEHNGSLPGFAAYFGSFVDREMTFIVLTNLYDATAGDIAREIASHYLAL